MCIYKVKKHKRAVTPYHVVSIVDWHKKHFHHTYTMQIINFEATTTQASSLFLAENVSLYPPQKKQEQKKNTILVKVADPQQCGAPCLTLAGHLLVCSASPRSTVKKEKPPCVLAGFCSWARHTQEGCCCHTQMHENVNLPGP